MNPNDISYDLILNPLLDFEGLLTKTKILVNQNANDTLSFFPKSNPTHHPKILSLNRYIHFDWHSYPKIIIFHSFRFHSA